MRRRAHRRNRLIGTSIAASIALLLGGGGLAIMNASANAGDSGGEGQDPGGRAATISCPEVRDELTDVPEQARADVDKHLATLDSQVAEAYKRMTQSQKADDRTYVDEAVISPLNDDRRETIGRITASVRRWAEPPANLGDLAECEAVPEPTSDDRNSDGDGGNDDGGRDGEGQNDGGQQGGPSPEDFVDITGIQPNVQEPQAREGASTGTFSTDCGVNENGKFNSDNVIAAPGVSNGAHHVHDYVGNQDNTAFSTNESLAAGRTTCADQEDQSTYYWPVVRLRNGQDERDADQPGGGRDGNIGEIQTPAEVTLTFQGSPVGNVVPMPRFLRIITGDAKSFTNGDANANASWSCTGFEDRQLKDKYPLCPEGSQVVRTFKFQSCWDGQNIDSANHRTHVVFANEDGECENGFRAIPQLVQRTTYDLPPGQVFAVDSFPEQLHKPITDHSDFINVMSDRLMAEAVECINRDEDCGDGAGGDGSGGDGGDDQNEPPAEDEPDPQQPGEQPQTPPQDGQEGNTGDDGGNGTGDNTGDNSPGDDTGDTPGDDGSSYEPGYGSGAEQRAFAPRTLRKKDKPRTLSSPKSAPAQAEQQEQAQKQGAPAQSKPKAQAPASGAGPAESTRQEAPERQAALPAEPSLPVNQPAGAPPPADAPDLSEAPDSQAAPAPAGTLPQDALADDTTVDAGDASVAADEDIAGSGSSGGGSVPVVVGAVLLGLLAGAGLMFLTHRRGQRGVRG